MSMSSRMCENRGHHHLQMKRFAPIAAVAVGSLLLIGCESRIDRNRHTCALFEATDIDTEEAGKRIGTGNAFVYCSELMS